MPSDIIIAIDGNSGCGKSSTAKALAKKLKYTYIDTGAMYRAVTHFFLENNIDITNSSAVANALAKLEIRFIKNEKTGKQETYTNGNLVDSQIRSKKVSDRVSEVSKIPAVRNKLVAEQQKMGEDKRIVMDGRDIGTVVFPEAELKVFMTANLEERAKRRLKELLTSGHKITLDEVKSNLAQRDKIDSARTHSPLKKAPDAYLLDTSGITFDNQVDTIYNWAVDLISDD